MRLFRSLLCCVVLLTAAAPAFADATLIVGTTTTPSTRAVKGFSFGVGQLIAFEFEYANTSEDLEDGAPGLRTFMGNMLVQTPFSIAGVQPYATAGTGFYRERLDTFQETSLGFNTGVGAKVTIFGPLRVRFDYRVFKLNGDPLYSTVHRVYSGFNLRF